MIVIEIAKINDIPKLSNLLTTLFSQEIEFIPNAKSQEAGLKEIIQNPSIGEILTIRKGDEIIGMVSLLYSVSTALGGKVATLEDMVIAPEFRQNGFGTKLLQKAIEHVQSIGALRITLLTDCDNEIAIKYYEENGFTKSSMIPLRQIF